MNLTNLIASQSTSHEVYKGDLDYDNLKKITYVTAANGIFRVEKTDIAVFKTKITDVKKSIPGLEEMEPGVELIIPKIPFKYLHMALSFYRDINDKDGSEASLLFFWNKDDKPVPTKYSDGEEIKGVHVDGKLIVYVPKQKNSASLSEFHMDPAVDYFRENFSILCETHSHNTMNAFFSATDDANENATQFYGVWGKVTNETPQFAFRFVSGDIKEEISPDVLFDWPVTKIETVSKTTVNLEGIELEVDTDVEEFLYPGPFPAIEYPDDWFGQHTKAVVYAKPYTGYTGTGNRYTPKSAGHNYRKPWRSAWTPGGNGYQTSLYDYDETLPYEDIEELEQELYYQDLYEEEEMLDDSTAYLDDEYEKVGRSILNMKKPKKAKKVKTSSKKSKKNTNL